MTAGTSRTLRAQTGLEVRDAIDGEPLRPGVVYIAPPNRHLLVQDGHLTLSDAPSVNFSRPSVDVLFDSVARVFSGMPTAALGRDGIEFVLKPEEIGPVVAKLIRAE